MKSKPSWALWFIWLFAYTALDMMFAALLHGGAKWDQVPGALEGALFGATVTWLFALYRWYKADNGS
jgi:prepilin signal peptidase PulO-like enzyme (type II secretory pathway)